MRAIEELGYEKPSPIQAEALPTLLKGPTDFLGLAATGTGKTAAFSIPMLDKIDPQVDGVQALVLCPTRELAIQVAGQIDLLGKYLGIRALPVYGGAGYGEQIRGLERGTAVVVGTPGRVIDHIEKGTLCLDEVSLLVLDEADEMISMGFKEDIEKVLERIPCEKSNIWLFSATMSGDVRYVADEYLTNPARVQINRKEMLPETIEQLYYRVHEGDKPEVLCKLMDVAPDFYGLVFCQTKALVVDLTHYLKSRGYKVDCLHGDMEQDARERVMRSFRDRKVTVLVCTDVASRGLDVKDITHVINYSIPRELDNYVHRIGRTARSGKKGLAMSLVTPSHRGLVVRIERMTKSRMKEGRVPTRREIGARKCEAALPRFMDQQPWYTRVLEVMGDEWKQAIAEMPAEEIAARFIAAQYPEVFADRVSAATGAGAGVSAGASAQATQAQAQTRHSIETRKPRMSPVAPLVKPVVRPLGQPVAADAGELADAAALADGAGESLLQASESLETEPMETEPMAVIEPSVDAEVDAVADASDPRPMLTLDAVMAEVEAEERAAKAEKPGKKKTGKKPKSAKSKKAAAAAEAPAATPEVAFVPAPATFEPAVDFSGQIEAQADEPVASEPVASEGASEAQAATPVAPLSEPVRRGRAGGKFIVKRARAEKPSDENDAARKPVADLPPGFVPLPDAPRGYHAGAFGKKRARSGFGRPSGGNGGGKPRTWSKGPKPKGWVGGRPSRDEGAGGGDVGLGRAPIDRGGPASSWSKPKGPWNGSPRASFGSGGAGGRGGRPYGGGKSFGGGKPFGGKKREGGFAKPRWNKSRRPQSAD
jgi:ATP-dependent RNA helicase DeaD